MTTFAPIAVFGYNRPLHLRQALEQLAAAEGADRSDVWIFCDGPKAGADRSGNDTVREVACDAMWSRHFQSVRVDAAVSNRGLAQSIIGGVTRVLDTSSRVIVLEDDLLVAPDFLQFVNDCLEFFEDDPQVGSISGFSPLAQPLRRYGHDIMAVPRNCSHGWGTWKDRWDKVDWTAADAQRMRRDPHLRRRFNAAGNDRLARLQRQMNGQIDSWSIRFGLWQTLSGRHTIYPVHNRVRNIGFDGSGIHTRSGHQVNDVALDEPRPYLLEKVREDPAILRAVARSYGGPWYRRALRGLRSRLGTVMP